MMAEYHNVYFPVLHWLGLYWIVFEVQDDQTLVWFYNAEQSKNDVVVVQYGEEEKTFSTTNPHSLILPEIYYFMMLLLELEI